jgi:TM2 domain-containing membrane protein YozV
MTSENIDLIIKEYLPFLKLDHLEKIKEKLKLVNDKKLDFYLKFPENYFKKPFTTILFSIFLGLFGADRIYLQNMSYMILLKIITAGGYFIWYFIDIFTAYNRTYKYNYNKIITDLIWEEDVMLHDASLYLIDKENK